MIENLMLAGAASAYEAQFDQDPERVDVEAIAAEFERSIKAGTDHPLPYSRECKLHYPVSHHLLDVGSLRCSALFKACNLALNNADAHDVREALQAFIRGAAMDYAEGQQ